MLTLAEASGYFDLTPILDPDNATELFFGQIGVYDDSKRDAGAAYRRILSVAADTTIPAARAIRALGQVYLVGAQELDGLETVHRAKYVLQAASLKASVYTLSGFVAGTAGTSAWAEAQWVKDGKETGESSNAAREHTIYLASGTALPDKAVITQGTRNFIVTSARQMASGFLAVEAVELDYPKSSAALTSQSYDPRTGVFTAGAVVTAGCQRVRWQNLFEQRSESAAAYRDGDDTLVLPSSTAVTTSTRITLAGKPWQVVSVDTLGGAVTVHARPAWAT